MRSLLLSLLLLTIIAGLCTEWMVSLAPAKGGCGMGSAIVTGHAPPQIASREVSMLGAALVRRGAAAMKQPLIAAPQLLPPTAWFEPSCLMDAAPLRLEQRAVGFADPPPRAFQLPLII